MQTEVGFISCICASKEGPYMLGDGPTRWTMAIYWVVILPHTVLAHCLQNEGFLSQIWK